MLSSDEYDLLLPDVRTAARTTARSWDGVIEFDDAEQEIWVRLLEAGRSTIDTVLPMDKPLRVRSLTRIGQQVGSQYRDDFEVFSGNWVYGTEDVRKMLDRDALGDERGDYGTEVPLWELPESIIDQLNRTDTETATERIDLFTGLKRLSKSNSWYAEIVICNYVDREPVHAHRKDLTRAVDALTKEMNRTHTRRKAEYEDGPGFKSHHTNRAAIGNTTYDYTGRIEDRR